MGIVLAPTIASAQPKMYNYETNYYNDYVGARVLITAPTSIQGQLVYTIANDGQGSGDWGGQIPSTPMINIPIVKADPYDACGTLTNATAISGKVALVKRGTCEFGAKALTAQQAGAVAVIIVNNIPGGPVGMGAGAQGGSVTIPVIMISDVDGAAIEAQMSNNPTITLSRWGNNKTHDIGIVNTGVSLWHNNAIPLNQMTGSTVPAPYKRIDGVVIANFGSSTESSIKLKASISWTPTGGSATVVKEDSTTISGNFAPGDSIMAPFIDNIYSLPAPTTTGKYDVTYTVSMSNADDYPKDNSQSYTYYITNNVFSKGRYDFINNVPFSNIAYAYQTASSFLFGPLYYVANGGYSVLSLQFAMSISGGGSLAGQSDVNLLVWKWTDGSNGQAADNAIQSAETKLVGVATKSGFTNTDSSGDFFSVAVADATNPNIKMVTEDNSWYWVTASIPSGNFLACDGVSNYYVRSWDFAKSSTPYKDHYAPIYRGAEGDFQASATEAPQMFPFETQDNVDTVRFSNQRKGIVPAISMVTNLFKEGVQNTNVSNPMVANIYPNPAKDVANISLELDNIAAKVYYTVMDVTGKRVIEEMHNNVKSDKFSISTSKLANGTYYLVISANDKATVRQFTVAK